MTNLYFGKGVTDEGGTWLVLVVGSWSCCWRDGNGWWVGGGVACAWERVACGLSSWVA